MPKRECFTLSKFDKTTKRRYTGVFSMFAQMNIRDNYFGVPLIPTADEAEEITHEAGPMVATELHMLIKSADHQALEDLVKEQLSDQKKAELIAYIRTQEHLFMGKERIKPAHLEFFYHLLNTFPLTCLVYEAELYTQFPSLQQWMDTASLGTVTNVKKNTKASLLGNIKRQNGHPSFLKELAIKIDEDSLAGFANQATTDASHLVSTGYKIKLPSRISVLSDTPDAKLRKFRTNFTNEIINTDKPLKKIIKIGDKMIQDGEFFTTSKAGHRVSTFKFANIYTSFACSQDANQSQLKSDTEDLTYRYSYNQNLLPGRTTGVKLRAIKSNDIGDWKEPIRTYARQMEEQGMPFDTAGKFAACIEALQTEKGLSEKDALVLYGYLTGQHSFLRTGPYSEDKERRGYGFLDDGRRWFFSSGLDDHDCSLLFARDG